VQQIWNPSVSIFIVRRVEDIFCKRQETKCKLNKTKINRSALVSSLSGRQRRWATKKKQDSHPSVVQETKRADHKGSQTIAAS
jgi:hypothetical protein